MENTIFIHTLQQAKKRRHICTGTNNLQVSAHDSQVCIQMSCYGIRGCTAGTDPCSFNTLSNPIK